MNLEPDFALSFSVMACVRGFNIESYEFDYDSSIYVFHGNMLQYDSIFMIFLYYDDSRESRLKLISYLGDFQHNMRNVFVLDLNPIAVARFKFDGTPVPIDQTRSMIDKRVLGTRVATVYPTNVIESAVFNLCIHMQQRFNRLLAFFLTDPDKFKPLNFFEYVLKCRYEHYLKNLMP